VVFVGPVYGEERRAALSCADVWALSSHAENFGIAVVEAMAASRPVVISPAVNLAGEVAREDAGIVADAEPDAFGNALLQILIDDDRRLRLANRGRAFASRYDWAVVAPRLVEMYRAALGPLRSRPEVAIGA
jgi:glycosyltransferase involved in cell wall biosynthesis